MTLKTALARRVARLELQRRAQEEVLIVRVRRFCGGPDVVVRIGGVEQRLPQPRADGGSADG